MLPHDEEVLYAEVVEVKLARIDVAEVLQKTLCCHPRQQTGHPKKQPEWIISIPMTPATAYVAKTS